MCACAAPTSPAATLDPQSIKVTLYETPATPTATAIPQQPTVTPAPTSTRAPTTHNVAADETLWTIAVRYHITVDELLAANPRVNADLLQIGATLMIPTSGQPLAASASLSHTITSDAEVSPQVSAEGVNLALRESPGTDAKLITRLPAYTPLKMIGRTSDSAWVKVETTEKKQGWVFVLYVDLNPTFSLSKVTVLSDQSAPLPVAAAAKSSANSTPAPNSANTPPQQTEPPASSSYPYFSGVGRASEIFVAGQKLGNRPNVFSVIGDSNSENPAFLKPIDWGAYDLGGYQYLRPTVDYFRGSFGRNSASAFGGFNTTMTLDPARAPSGCAAGENSLQCEYRLARPSIALIMLGTGDQHAWQGFEERYRKIIDYTISQGIIPVLQTKADDLETRDNNAPLGTINGIIRRLASEYRVPLLDVRAVMDTLPNRGCISDGFHYNKPPDGQAAYFSSSSYMQYGFNQRNLMALQALDLLRRQVIGLR
jgi:LysM repeat protein